MYETLISPNELQSLVQSDNSVVIVDCRFSLANPEWGRGEFAAGHLPGAVYAHLDEDLSDPVQAGITGRHPLPDPEKLIKWIRAIGISNETQVVAYDQGGGGIAARLWWLLRWTGLDSVAVLERGYPGWLDSGFGISREIVDPAPSMYVPAWRNSMIIDISGIMDACNSKNKVIVDSRDERRYAGIEEPIDPVAGHIPGAINLPFAGNLQSDGGWRDREFLHGRFKDVVGDRNCSDVVFYCGSGVTACHNILAFKHAGLGDALLYAGSWSEWITDTRRGVEVSSYLT